MFVLTNERYKTYQTGSDFRGLGVQRASIFFFKHGHVAYQIDGDDEQNRMHVIFFYPRVKLVTLW